MALSFEEINRVMVAHVLHDRDSIKQAIRAAGPDSLPILRARCEDLGLNFGELLGEVISDQYPFERLRRT